LGDFVVVHGASESGLIQATAAAKDTKSANRRLIIAAVLLIPIGFFCALIGIIAAAELPGLCERKNCISVFDEQSESVGCRFALAGLCPRMSRRRHQ
jgi:SSS family solute:Na+ symporter